MVAVAGASNMGYLPAALVTWMKALTLTVVPENQFL